MTLPFTLPDWLPWWVPILFLVPALLYALAFLFMPFSVIGVKSRLEAVEARLDEIQGEIRHLSLRLPEVGRAADYDEICMLRDRASRRGGRRSARVRRSRRPRTSWPRNARARRIGRMRAAAPSRGWTGQGDRSVRGEDHFC